MSNIQFGTNFFQNYALFLQNKFISMLNCNWCCYLHWSTTAWCSPLALHNHFWILHTSHKHFFLWWGNHML